MNVNTEVIKLLKDIEVPVFFLVCKTEPKPYVYITFFEVVAVEGHYADDKPATEEINIQIDIWSTFGSSITKVKNNIIRAMKNGGWTLTRKGSDMYEKDTNTLHKPLEFRYESEVI